MRELLPLLPRPSHYLGTEVHAVHKTVTGEMLRMALAFPDLYEVGMSYVGQKILYAAVNAHPNMWAERVFAPAPEAAKVLREHNAVLTTLESDTPLAQMDVLAFSLTHELCYTSILYMLDLAGIPFRAAQRQQGPVVIAGGGNAANAAPVTPFFDALVVGDGEEVLLEVGEAVRQVRRCGGERSEILARLASIPGVEVPGFGQKEVERRLVVDLDASPFPSQPVLPFGKPVHDRFSLEIARGCTRGCRFCHAGMTYRPVRERSLPELERLIREGLDATGYEELSFLSLSTGDFSVLETLFTQSYSRCLQEQVAVALPSLRVGSVSEQMMGLIAKIRRTGATLAPEAGSQRLRDVINKGITEEALLQHTEQLFAHGWQSIKLYFMIGLPTETEEDLEAIFDLCRKVRHTAGKQAKRVQITASISPFVPKPHTPFQWERQLSCAEVHERIGYLQNRFRHQKGYKLRWHQPEMSFLEGVFSRGDAALADSIEQAYQEGDILTSWAEYFKPELWERVFAACAVDPVAYLQARDTEESLPWDHIKTGVSKRFLFTERKRALAAKETPDCRYATCRACGACNFGNRSSELTQQAKRAIIRPRINSTTREAPLAEKNWQSQGLQEKKGHFRIWYAKTGPARFLSQLELQSLFERALRRADIPLSFSAGFHPMPLLSFGPALPVGVQSMAEWFNVFVRQSDVQLEALQHSLYHQFPQGLRVYQVQELGLGKRQAQAVAEDFELEFHVGAEQAAIWQEHLHTVLAQAQIPWERKTKRRGWQVEDARPFFEHVHAVDAHRLRLRFSWREKYVSPLQLVRLVLPGPELDQFTLTKLEQIMHCQGASPEVHNRVTEHS
ncbi:MAG: TIGR03960 family B12-binding radical SAM protein [Thermodesulfobacteriota bacterium]